MNYRQIFVRLFLIPELSTESCFGNKMIPHNFSMVDWFNMPLDIEEQAIKNFLKPKPYYHAGKKILILGENNYSLVIDCD